MKRSILAALVPPAAVWRFCAVGSCAAPIAVFWFTGIVGLVYGYLGGPVPEAGICKYTMSLGLLLWAIAAVWASLTVLRAEGDKENIRHPRPLPSMDETDPLEEVKKARNPSRQ